MEESVDFPKMKGNSGRRRRFENKNKNISKTLDLSSKYRHEGKKEVQKEIDCGIC